MKVAHINAGNEYGGGLVHIVSLLKELKDKQCDLIVLEEGPVSKAARQEGIPVHVFQQANRYDLTVLVRVIRFLKKKAYTHIHTHGPRANTLAYMMHRFISVTWITTIHSHPSLDFKDNGIKGRVFEHVNKRSITKADGVIAVSNEIKESIERLGIPESRIYVINNGITFSEPLKGEKEQPDFTLLTIGRLHPVKGYPYLIEALKTFPYPNWQWLVCGEGEEEKALKQLCKESSIASQVSFLGWLPSEEVKMVASDSHVFVHPSLSESFPLVILEAAEQELPVIATDVGDVKEIIRDDTMGWLIQPKNAADLRKALIEAYELWQNNQLKEKGIVLRQWAEQFSLSQQAEHVLDVYKEMKK
ncbi:glycosyltransferase family 4 protein [Alkalibacterium iburiense]|uniref:Glycosyltransferase family 4 protein n=1 Tax=Alkalibacterium iburiense TaxID=290589 RepID=A0ABN0XN75_9LACT